MPLFHMNSCNVCLLQNVSPGVVLEQLQYCQHQVVHVAEAAGLTLLGMVQPATPVDGRVAQPVVEPHSTLNAGTGIQPAGRGRQGRQQHTSQQTAVACQTALCRI